MFQQVVEISAGVYSFYSFRYAFKITQCALGVLLVGRPHLVALLNFIHLLTAFLIVDKETPKSLEMLLEDFQLLLRCDESVRD